MSLTNYNGTYEIIIENLSCPSVSFPLLEIPGPWHAMNSKTTATKQGLRLSTHTFTIAE